MNLLNALMADSEVQTVIAFSGEGPGFVLLKGELPKGLSVTCGVQGVRLVLDAGITLSAPVTWVWQAANANFGIQLGADSALQLTEVWRVPMTQNQVIELGEKARLDWGWFENIETDVAIELNQKISCGAGSTLNLSTASLGGSKVRMTCDTLVAGSGAVISSVGGLRGRGSQVLDFKQKNDHVAPNGISSMDLYTVMDGESRATFTAMIRIPKSGIKTQAIQRNKNLLLSRKASVQTLPQLEIETDDVQCAHGASISQVDENQMIYLRSRGLSVADAQSMIVNGFTAPVVSRFFTKAIRSQVQAAFSGAAAETESVDSYDF